ncbi:MAG: hypothetical protein ABIA63_11440 [bacterium]
MKYDPEFLKEIFRKTEIFKKPISGIVSGYHNLPYVLIGPDENSDRQCIQIKGQIDVSPRMIFTPQMLGATYGEIFGEDESDEIMDKQLVGRVFSFMYTNKFNVKVENKKFNIQKKAMEAKKHIEAVLDNLEKGEIINTGVIFAPNIHFYPVSIDRFISDILNREFGVI